MTIDADPKGEPTQAPSWNNIVTQKRTIQLDLIPEPWRLPAELTTAFCKRAAISQQVNKCLTEIFFERAIQRAKNLDEILARTGEVIGPLHGIPVSVKDRFDVEGVDTTVGWVGLTNKPAQSNSSVVQLLESMGAVLYVKTNVPQSLMMSDSYNHVFGQSVNAFNHALISGGSSGGEGALIGSRGSILGVGTDIGGSIRVPSGLQGLYSICPTTGRVPWDCSFLHQHYLIPPVAGPMATSLATTEYFIESLLKSDPWNIDPGAIPIPWRKELAAPPTNRKLKLGVVFDDGVVKPQPPVARAMRETVDALRAAGHEGTYISLTYLLCPKANIMQVIEWDTALHAPATNLWTRGILADGGQHCHSLCQIVDEPLIEGMVVGTDKDLLTIQEREKLEETKYALQTTFLKQWVGSGIDALIMPVLPWVGYKPKTWVRSKQWLGYTAMWNLLDYAGVTVPVTRADRILDSVGNGLDVEWEGHSIRNESDAFNYLQCEFCPVLHREMKYAHADVDSVTDDINLVHGMPICVQIVGGRFGEEKAVAVGKVVDELMNPTPFHS
ncbi:uncharacterized protein N7511_003842 [Penicillium nucicola]|uniref:uncharacterized protein n=1 Tax=Penicillium nucicola TaxID=1850975 RepID=UPI0025451BCE|nr:uncharacterized protein N7511_003842 [Penicillium nucicola]KAJ5766226.1 hypothetical protein N7511_003842 [Penicillium nucicola]